MRIEHTKSVDLNTNKWSGGTTTQLAIYPYDAEYKKQDFIFRISTANVNTEESSFTKLINVSRKLMILDGEIRIVHKNHHSKILKKFEQDKFSGDWETKSFGKAIDFNLMTNGKASGDIVAIIFDKFRNISLETDFNYYSFYIFKGETALTVQDQLINAKKGDVINIYVENEIKKINIQATPNCELFLCKIKY